MGYQGDEIERLVLATRRALLPATFPPRRDLDVAHLTSDDVADATFFHDAFWVDRDRLACFVVRVGDSARGCLGAHGFRALLRAALRTGAPSRALGLALDAFQRFEPGIGVDAAVAVLCACTGEAAFAAHGEASAVRAAHEDGAPDATSLAAGGFGWLSVGPVRPPSSRSVVESDAAELVRAAVAGTRCAGAMAIGLRSVRPRGERTFVLPNEVAEISPLLEEIGACLVAAGVPAAMYAGMEVALDEHLTNVLLYAYGDGRAHEVIVTVCVTGAVVQIEVEDDGMPFDPTTSATPDLSASLEERPLGGLGLHLIRSVFDRAAYERSRRWNVLTLTKSFAKPPVASLASGAAGRAAADRSVLEDRTA